jgi:hypothetical protein
LPPGAEIAATEFANRVHSYPFTELLVEHDVELSPECRGRLDAATWDGETRTLRVYEFKWGRAPVEAKGNWQLLTYAAGLRFPALRTVFTVYQPRNGGFSEWEPGYQEGGGLVGRVWDRIDPATGAEDEYSPGAWCRNCHAAGGCSALASVAKPPDTAGLDLGAEVVALWESLALVKARLTALEAEATARLMRGERVDGLALAPSRGRTVWAATVEELKAFAAFFNPSVPLTREEPITVTEARALGYSDEVLTGLIEKKPGGAKLVPSKNPKELFK